MLRHNRHGEICAYLRGRPSSQRKFFSASSFELPQIIASGLNPLHTAGLEGLPNNAHFRSAVRCKQGTIAGLPSGIPGMAELMEGKIQQAAQPDLH